ncbi:hypothetical protein ENTCAN_08196 [Enterobacter cancerogenus ATCC 35316]|nr:hypothetical protein ENTCAN_08196 [Enterobacter cancerogenus ATCC 35316]
MLRVVSINHTCAFSCYLRFDKCFVSLLSANVRAGGNVLTMNNKWREFILL